MPTYHRTYALACSCGDTVDAPNVEAAVAMDEPYPCIPHTPPQPGMTSLHDRAMGEDTP